jgi:hypothetical protein
VSEPGSRRHLAAALAVTGVLVGLTVVDALASGGIVAIIRPGVKGPSAAIIEHDFPNAKLPPDFGHDGQQYYAIGRSLPDVGDAEPYLDSRPRYRARRIFLPAAARALALGATGTPLVVGMVVVNGLGCLLGALAIGQLGRARGLPAWTPLMLLAVPGAITSLRLTTPDLLGFCLAIAAIAAMERSRPGAAVVLAGAAALSRETMLLLFAGYWLGARSRRATLPMIAGVVALAGWELVLRASLPDSPNVGADLAAPLTGIWRAFAAVGDDVPGATAAGVVVAVAVPLLAIAALVARRRDPFWVGLLVPLVAFHLVLNQRVLYNIWDVSRATISLQVVAMLALVSHPRVVAAVAAGRQPSDAGLT